MKTVKSPAHQIVMTTCPDRDTAQHIAQVLVQQRLAACVNVLPAMQSIYLWRGKVETATEHLLLIKSKTRAFRAIQKCILERHPYELPEIIAVPVTTGLPSYLSWLENPDRTR